jgi:hypothetical protein
MILQGCNILWEDVLRITEIPIVTLSEKISEVFPGPYIMGQSFPMSEPTPFWMGVR